MSEVDVLVVGAGPTGLTMASELLRRGLSVRVVDEADAPTTLSKAIAVHARTLEILCDLGVEADLLARGVPLHGATLWANGEAVASIDLGGLDTRFPFVLSVAQSETEAVLGALVEQRGGRVERSTELVSFEAGPDAVDAVLRTPRGTERVRAAWLVGCDGAHSTVRHGLGASFEGHAYEDTFALADVHAEWDAPDDRISTFLADDGVAACFPMKHGRLRVILSAANDAPTLESVTATLAARSGKHVVLTDPVWITSFRIHCRQIERYRHGRVFLAGDAAHIHSPAGGQGMNTGIQDAHNLAWKLALVHAGRGRDVLLDSYHVERHAVGRALLRSTDVATRIGTMTGSLAASVRNQLARVATSLDGVRARMARGIAELEVGYPKSPIVGEHTRGLIAARLSGAEAAETPTIGSSVAFRGVARPGTRAPDAEVTTEDGRRARLSSLASGSAFTLLLFDGRSPSAEGYRTLAAIAEDVSKRFGPCVRSWLVTPQPARPAGVPASLPVLLDTERALEARYGATTECLYLVRPDLYVGYRTQPADGEALRAFLASILA